jgi:predicted glycosyltransferase involved in capsule biosynthesis
MEEVEYVEEVELNCGRRRFRFMIVLLTTLLMVFYSFYSSIGFTNNDEKANCSVIHVRYSAGRVLSTLVVFLTVNCFTSIRIIVEFLS